MSYAITFRPKARKEFFELAKPTRLRLERHLEALADDPRAGDTRKLRGRAGALRLRVGDYRILYLIDHDGQTIDVLRVRPRGSAYK